ncbi:MAG: glutathione peroxidase [Candidatus Cloacimonetes bacterium]|nr:glutathione peroxidase [Candidatus Cloacimonadota bacterium]
MSLAKMNIYRVMLLVIILLGGAMMMEAKQLYDFQMKSLNGKDVKLEDYKGKVLLIVNTASKCGFTKQYADLQALYEKYEGEGLVVLGFPANNFLNQEPGDNAAIAQFCSLNYGVSFPMFEKISVKGKSIHPLYKYLTDKKTNPAYGGKISWNFNKFLISRKGEIINRFSTQTSPMGEEVLAAIEKALK